MNKRGVFVVVILSIFFLGVVAISLEKVMAAETSPPAITNAGLVATSTTEEKVKLQFSLTLPEKTYWDAIDSDYKGAKKIIPYKSLVFECLESGCPKQKLVLSNVGFAGCNYEISLDIPKPKTPEDSSNKISCKATAACKSPDDKYKLTGCSAEAPPQVAAGVPGSSGQSVDSTLLAGNVIASNKDSKSNGLNWNKIFIFALIAMALTLTVAAKKRSRKNSFSPRKPSNLHHFLNSNKYSKSLQENH